MHIQLIEKKEWVLTEDAFAVYRQCMYKPTYEAYRNKINHYIIDKQTRIFACLTEKIVGIIVLTITDDDSAELMGIAVDSSLKRKGIGSFMIRESANKMNLHTITAETDDDAVGFYKKMGFDILKEIKHYDNERVVRYHCSLTL